MYRLGRIWATLTVVVALSVVGLAGGCKTSRPPVPDPEIALEGTSNAELLFHAMETTFKDRGLGVDIASEDKLIILSPYKPISERLRRRYAGRIVLLRGGAAALRIRAEHQRKHGKKGDAVWRSVESPVLAERAAEDELKLARAIERRFREWKEMREEGEAEQKANSAAAPSDEQPQPDQ